MRVSPHTAQATQYFYLLLEIGSYFQQFLSLIHIFSQLVRDYGDKEAKVVMNTVGNIFSGQVVGETAKTLSERFGKRCV